MSKPLAAMEAAVAKAAEEAAAAKAAMEAAAAKAAEEAEAAKVAVELEAEAAKAGHHAVKETHKPSSVGAIRVGCYTEEAGGGREDPGGLFKGAFF